MDKRIKIKKVRIIMAMIMMLIIGTASYSRASSFSFKAEANKVEVTPGEEVIIEMKVSDIDMGEHGINVVEGNLEYDESFFSRMEYINTNEWEITYNNEEGTRKGKFLIAKMAEGVKEEECVGKIKIKVREDISEGEGQVNIRTIQSNDGEALVDEGERVINVKIKKAGEEPEPPFSDNEENKIIGEEYNNSEEKEKQNAETGDKIAVVLGVMAVVVLANIGIVILNRRKNKTQDN